MVIYPEMFSIKPESEPSAAFSTMRWPADISANGSFRPQLPTRSPRGHVLGAFRPQQPANASAATRGNMIFFIVF